MLADKASRIPARGARLLAEARRVCRVVYWQLISRDDLLCPQVGHRDLGRRDEEHVLCRKIKHVVLELRQLTGARHRLAVCHERRKDLGIALLFGVQVEHEVDDSPFELCAKALVHREPRTGDLACALEVQDIQPLADVPVSLRFEAELPRLADSAQFDIVGIVFTCLHLRIRNVRYAKKHIPQFLLYIRDFTVEFLDPGRQLLHLFEQLRNVLSLLLKLRHLSRGDVLLVLEGLDLGEDLSSLHIEISGSSDIEIALAASLDTGFDFIKMFSDPFDIQHFCVPFLSDHIYWLLSASGSAPSAYQKMFLLYLA